MTTLSPADFSPYCDAFLDDPAPFFEVLREEAPVHRDEDTGAFFLSRFEDIWAATQDRRLSVARGISPSQLLLGSPANPLMPSQMDPPQHTRLRSKMSPAFRPAAATGWEGEIRSLARDLLVRARPGGRLDIARDYGGQIAAHMACRLLGFPVDRASELPPLMNGFFHRRPGHRGETEKAVETATRLYELGREHIEVVCRDRAGAGGLIGDLARSDFDGETLGAEALVEILVNLLIAASDSFPKALSGAVDRLLRNPDDLEAVRRDGDLILPAFLESLRIDTPTQFQGRTVLEPLEIRGQALEPGDRVCFLFPAANRDPREFERPLEFDLRRTPRRTLAFGNGIHLCLGKQIALVEARVALEELLRALPAFEFDASEARFARTEYVRGWLRYPVIFDRRTD